MREEAVTIHFNVQAASLTLRDNTLTSPALELFVPNGRTV